MGFCQILQQWHRDLSRRNDAWLASWPPDIELMFDKINCHRACHDGGVPVAESLGAVSCFDELVARMEATRMSRVFVKLAHGSSASGVVAFRRHGDRMEAVTSAEMVASRNEVLLYNSLKIRRYTKLDEVRLLIDSLATHGVHVEQWLPKATLGRRPCDLRVVVIDGRPQHLVVRTSRSPLTNLQLGNRRGDTAELLGKLGDRRREELRRTCIRVAGLFPKSLQMGIDILFTPGFRKHALLEVNAFGDLLPRVRFHGKSTYEPVLFASRAVNT